MGASIWKILALIDPSPASNPLVAKEFRRGSMIIALNPPAPRSPKAPTNPAVTLRERKLIVAISQINVATTVSSMIRVLEPIAIAPAANIGINMPILRSRVSKKIGRSTPNKCMPI